MHRFGTAAVAALCAAATVTAGTTTVTVERETPDEDRWMYPFNAAPGTRSVGSTFGAVLIDGFDDHDAQFHVGFNTGDVPTEGMGVVPAGLGEERYEIVAATLTLYIGDAAGSVYDSDMDPWTSYLLADDPEFTADEDGLDFQRPMMLFGAGYRGGFGIEEGTQLFVEDSPFGGMGFPVNTVRNAFATDYFEGSARDISNNIRDRFEIFPFAIGQVFSAGDGIPRSEGEVIGLEDRVEFTLDMNNPDVVSYLQWSLNQGTVRLTASSLHVAFGGEGGASGPITQPVFLTKEDTFAPLLGQRPRLDMVVNILPEMAGADLNGDGAVDGGDLAILLAAWGTPGADLNGDGVTDGADLAILLAAWG